jgi:hypothetical protein
MTSSANQGREGRDDMGQNRGGSDSGAQGSTDREDSDSSR